MIGMIYIKLLILRITLLAGVAFIGFLSISSIYNSEPLPFQTIFGLILLMVIGIMMEKERKKQQSK